MVQLRATITDSKIEVQVQGIFAIMCPDCGAPVDQQRSVAGTVDAAGGHEADDVLVCAGCSSAFVVRFGHALAVPRSDDVGVA